MSEINDRIDKEILGSIQRSSAKGRGLCSGYLAGIIDHLPVPDANKPQPAHWWLAELANRSCQRLRKRGMIYYDAKTGWHAVVCESSGAS